MILIGRNNLLVAWLKVGLTNQGSVMNFSSFPSLLLFLSLVGAKNSGLKNIGNLCRFNAMFQALFHVDLVRDAILNHPGDVIIQPVNNKGNTIDVKKVFQNLGGNVLDSCQLQATEQEPAFSTFNAIAAVVPFENISGFQYLVKSVILFRMERMIMSV